jgi:signal transduction histidine kinase
MNLTLSSPLIALLVVVVASIMLAYVVYRSDSEKVIRRIFILFSFALVLWSMLMYLSTEGSVFLNALIVTRLTIFVATPLSLLIALLAYVLPNTTWALSQRRMIVLMIVTGAVMCITLTPYAFKDVTNVNGESIAVSGPGMLPFAIFTTICSVYAIVILIKKLIYSKNQQDRQRLTTIVSGMVGMLSLIIGTIFLPVVLWKDSFYVPFAPLYVLFFLFCTAVAILRYKLFDIKIIATELLVSLLVSLLIFEGLFASSFTAILYKFLFATLMGCVGILLVRSIQKEIDERKKITVLASSLETANFRLQELDKQKTDFLSIATHQLRTPLSIANGYIELLEDGAYGNLPAESKEILRNMDESNQRLVKLVDEFLDITRIEQGRTTFSFKPSQISTIARSVVSELRDRAKEHKLHLQAQIENLPSIVLDEDKVRQVVFNFIDNAIKYSETGTVNISAQDENDGVSLRVIDEGVGFNKIDAANFFQKFYRGENVKGTNVTGTGLGLYVCRMFIEAHHGRVWAKSAGLGQGSEFGFWLPFNQTAVSKQTV